MSKLLKFLGSLGILAIVLANPFNLTASAQTLNDFSNEENVLHLKTETINIMDNNPVPGLIIKDITREEYVENVAKAEGISYEKADMLVAERTSKSLSSLQKERGAQSISPKAIVWRQTSWLQAYPDNSNFIAELNASFEIYSTSSFKQINSSTVGSSIAAGINTSSWKQSNSWKTTAYPVTVATVGVSGKFYSTVTNTAGVSGGISGFTVSGSTSNTTTFVSKTLNIERKYSVN